MKKGVADKIRFYKQGVVKDNGHYDAFALADWNNSGEVPEDRFGLGGTEINRMTPEGNGIDIRPGRNDEIGFDRGGF